MSARDPTVARNAYKSGCNFPGDVPPATSPCTLDCTRSFDFADGGNDGGCGCTSACSGHTYALACTATECTCSKDSVSATLAPPTSCSAPADDYTFGCNFPGAFGLGPQDASVD